MSESQREFWWIDIILQIPIFFVKGWQRWRRSSWGREHNQKEGGSHFQWHVQCPLLCHYCTYLILQKIKKRCIRKMIQTNKISESSSTRSSSTPSQVVRRTYPRREAETQTDKNTNDADDSPGQQTIGQVWECFFYNVCNYIGRMNKILCLSVQWA